MSADRLPNTISIGASTNESILTNKDDEAK